MSKYPCRNCIYFKVCGENTRTKPCDGRTTKTDKKKETSFIWSSWNTEIITNFNRKLSVKEIEEEIKFLISTNKKHGIDYLRIKNF